MKLKIKYHQYTCKLTKLYNIIGIVYGKKKLFHFSIDKYIAMIPLYPKILFIYLI